MLQQRVYTALSVILSAFFVIAMVPSPALSQQPNQSESVLVPQQQQQPPQDQQG